jgi:hypothetical protein
LLCRLYALFLSLLFAYYMLAVSKGCRRHRHRRRRKLLLRRMRDKMRRRATKRRLQRPKLWLCVFLIVCAVISFSLCCAAQQQQQQPPPVETEIASGCRLCVLLFRAFCCLTISFISPHYSTKWKSLSSEQASHFLR